MLALSSLAAVAFGAARTLPAPHAAAAARSAVRAGPIVLQDLKNKPTLSGEENQYQPDLPIAWTPTPSGFRYIDDTVGTGTLPDPTEHPVVQLHYTVTLLSSGTTIGSSRGRAPLTMALAKHEVPIWDEALVGMRVGGKRRMLVPPDAIPESQKSKVPGEARTLRFDFELLGVLDKDRPLARLASALPPGTRRFQAFSNTYFYLFALSFVPYVLPQSMQPAWYHDGMTPEQIQERRVARERAAFLGSDLNGLNGLFPEETIVQGK